ncbi:L,D-transpeptidase family protein [Mesobacillus zeae]|uniref:LysM peptidoglycan-binding domain-containing protein n=1 Tax=Mesobacillus zeae TaxID=1917180 RepID=A0A398BD74_9BACI|nr:L,D-transpeptidase family protein [Mesobacillus zeae]RID87822.1 LysM peptidoglycan-binding domain-containing protein [Mesobacillus zeae]
MIHIVKRGETLASLSADFRRSQSEIIAANRGKPIIPGQAIVIPGLPEPSSIPFSILVSVSRKKLTIFRNGKVFKTYPIATGKMLTRTPFGTFIIVNREPNPGGPFGAMWLSLSKRGYGIHGTNKPSSIGQSVSKGCIRMYNKDVLELARIIPNGTLTIIRP